MNEQFHDDVFEDVDLTDAILFVDSAHGVYIPQIFFQQIKHELLFWDLDQEYKDDILAAMKAGPDHEEYWTYWETVLDCVFVKKADEAHLDKGYYNLHHDGDLWLVPPRD